MEEEEESSRVSKRELIHKEWRRIARGRDDDEAAERRYARMDELTRDELRAIRSIFKGLDRACGINRWKAAAGPRISFRLVGGRLVRETHSNDGEQQVTDMEMEEDSKRARDPEREAAHHTGPG